MADAIRAATDAFVIYMGRAGHSISVNDLALHFVFTDEQGQWAVCNHDNAHPLLRESVAQAFALARA